VVLFKINLNNLRLKIIFIVFFTSLYSNITAQTGKISGLIIDAETYKPLNDVEIIIQKTSWLKTWLTKDIYSRNQVWFLKF